MAGNVDIYASDIAKFLDSKLLGTDFRIIGVASAHNPMPGRLSFVASCIFKEQPDIGALFIVPVEKEIPSSSKNSYIRMPNPRLAYAQAVQRFFFRSHEPSISKTAIIAASCVIGEGCTIGEYVILEDDVQIGKETIIGHHTSILKGCIVGSNCIVNPGTVIGSEGLGTVRNDEGVPIATRHLGTVVIRDNVEIGANSTIQRATIERTLIEQNVKSSPQVNIGHNCTIGMNTEIASGVHICGSVTVKKNCFLGARCTIKDTIKIGDNAKIGLGAVVFNDVAENATVLGLEALTIRDMVRFKSNCGYGLSQK